MSKTGISEKWSKMSISWLGNPDGMHCHWCEYSVSEDGEVTCSNKKSKYFDGNRIRTWDGEECAKNCLEFDLSDWYKSDENYDKTFDKE